jgi:hypothetical protein
VLSENIPTARAVVIKDAGHFPHMEKPENVNEVLSEWLEESESLLIGISAMDFGKFHFGKIEIDGVIYERDVVVDRGRIRKRKKQPSKKFRQQFGHTPVSVEEEIPWNCQRLVVGTGRYGSLPVMDEVKLEARRRKVALLILPTEEAIETLANQPKRTNAILHVTC